jgi:hypothetical protein
MIPNAFTSGASMHAISPSRDFRNTVDPSQLTKAIYLGPTTGVAFNVTNPVTEQAVTFRTGGTMLPVQTFAAVAVTGFEVVYLY